MADTTKATTTGDSGFFASGWVRFVSGAGLGLLLVAIPFFISGMPLGALTAVQMGVVAMVPWTGLAIATLLGGTLGLIFGEKLFNGVLQMLEDMGGY